MEHLISMTDFILKLGDNSIFYNKVTNYAKFLKKEHKLGYFVACDENDVPLEEPKHYDLWKKYGSFTQYGESIVSECSKFHEAKQRVLFEGFELVDNNDKSWIFRLNGKFPYIIYKTTSVEFLTKLNQKPKLTETAEKEIGLEDEK